MIAVYFYRDDIHQIFTKDIEIRKVMIHAWSIIVIFVFFDCIQGVANGAILGLGVLDQVKWVTFLDYFVVGIPVSYYAMIHYNLGIQGLWVGPTVAVVLNYVFYQIVISKADWQ